MRSAHAGINYSLQHIVNDVITSVISVLLLLVSWTIEEVMEEADSISVPSYEATSTWKQVIHRISDNIIVTRGVKAYIP